MLEGSDQAYLQKKLRIEDLPDRIPSGISIPCQASVRSADRHGCYSSSLPSIDRIFRSLRDFGATRSDLGRIRRRHRAFLDALV